MSPDVDPDVNPDVRGHSLTVGPAQLEWDAGRRRLTLRFVETGVGTGEHATQLSRQARQWTDGGPYTFLVDCTAIADVNAGWRNEWADHFRDHRDEATVAWFNANARIRLIVLLFRKGTGVRGRSFATETDAERWLDEAAPA